MSDLTSEAGVILTSGYLLDAKHRKRMVSRSWEVSVQGLLELADDAEVGPAARTALRCERILALVEVAEAARHDKYDPPHRPGTCGICDAFARLDALEQ